MIKFTKMQGCGNDYIYINGFEEKIDDISALAIEMSERHFGVGADGLVMILPADNADFTMRMFNNDGSEAEMCGNAIRCVGKYVYDRKLTDKTEISISTLAGIKILQLHLVDGVVDTVTVDMGEPELKAELIPVISEKFPVVGENVIVLGENFPLTCVNTGNPHGIAFVENVSDFEVEKFGKELEVHEIFPRKANIEFVEVLNKSTIKMRVWERGTGETLACGTGSCASVIACVLNGFTGREVTVKLLGGELMINWNENDNHIFMTGPARFSFDGVWLR